MDLFLQDLNNLQVISPILYLIIRLCFILVYGSWIVSQKQLAYPIVSNITNKLTISIFSILVCATSTYHTSIPTRIEMSNRLIGGAFSINWNNATIILVLRIASLLVFIGSQNYFKKGTLVNYETTLIILFSFIAIYTIVCSTSFISLYLGLELQALSFYVISGLQRNSAFSTEAALKYFLLGAFISGILLFGIGLIYSESGILLFEDLTRLIWRNDINLSFVLGILLILIAILFKLGAAPFHQWLPDVYEGSPLIIRSYFAIVPKIAIFYIILILTQGVFRSLIQWWSPLLLIRAFFSICIGTFGRLTQQKLKRFFAYRSIGHTGYILLRLSTGSYEGIIAGLVYRVLYLVMRLSLWIRLLAIQKYKPIIINSNWVQPQSYTQIFYLRDLIGLYNTNKTLAFYIGICIFSIAGIPPLGGFLAKFLVLLTTTKSHYYFINGILILVAVIGAFYYLRWLKLIIFEKLNKNQRFQLQPQIRRSTAWLLILRNTLLLLVLINPESISNWAQCFILV